MLKLECYWYDKTHPVDPKQRRTFESECVGELIQQAFLQKLAVSEFWVGWMIKDENGDIVECKFTDDSITKTLYAAGHIT